MSTVRQLGVAVALAVLPVAVACGSTDSEFGDANGASSGASGSGSSGSSGGSSGGFGSSGASGASGSGGASGGNGTPEICDGIDNDANGIIDDVDVGNDGVCDCLRIATLGAAGKWGQGDVFANWLNGKSDKGAVSLAGQTLTRALLDQYQVVVVQDVSVINRSYATAEVTALKEWVDAGGGLLTLIGYADPNERANVNLLLASFGTSYGSTQILKKPSGGSTVPVAGWTMHAVTAGVTKIGVDNGYPVEGSGATLATEQSFVLLKAIESGKGHVLAWGDEWITYNSEWSGHPDYQVERFWLNMIKWLTPSKECQVPIPPSVK